MMKSLDADHRGHPGLVWHDNLLYTSYYSTHEGKTSIYLAKIKITVTE